MYMYVIEKILEITSVLTSRKPHINSKLEYTSVLLQILNELRQIFSRILRLEYCTGTRILCSPKGVRWQYKQQQQQKVLAITFHI